MHRFMLVWVFIIAVALSQNSALAQSRTDTGRHKAPVQVVSDKGDQTLQSTPTGPRWLFKVDGGMLGGADLFRASNSSGEPVAWIPDSDEPWLSHRIKVRMESSFVLGLQIQRQMGDWYSLRAGFSYSETDIVAEAPIEEVAEVFPYDTAEIWMFSLGTEVRLTQTTASYPYFSADLLVVGFSPENSGFLAQTNFGGKLGLGYHHQFDPVWSFNFEAGISRSAFSSAAMPTPVDVEPGDLEYENENHLMLFEAKFAIGVKI